MCSSGLIINPLFYTNFPACLDTVTSHVFVPWNDLYYAREVYSRILRSSILLKMFQGRSLAPYICGNSLQVFFLLPLEFWIALRYLTLLQRSVSVTQRVHI